MHRGFSIAEESRTHTPCGENFSRLMPNLASQDAYLASTRFDKIHQKIQRRRVLCSFARANISQMQRENAKQYKILRAFSLPQVQIFAEQNRVSSALFGYKKKDCLNSPFTQLYFCLAYYAQSRGLRHALRHRHACRTAFYRGRDQPPP